MSDIKQIETEMKRYNTEHKLETLKNYNLFLSKDNIDKRLELAKYIHDNYNTMDDIEMQTMLTKCLDIHKIKSLLLQYELENYEEEELKKYMSLDEFKKKALYIFTRYQCKAGGFLMEDSEWIIHDKTTTNYDVKENELLFENTINIIDVNNNEIDTYLFYIIKRLTSLSENIDVELRQQVKNKTVHLLIWVTDMTKEDIVGL
jgi:hypothetical protein